MENKNNVSYIIKDPLNRSKEEYKIDFKNNFNPKAEDNTCIKIVSFYFNSGLKNHFCFKTLDFCTNIKNINNFTEIKEKIIDYKKRRRIHLRGSSFEKREKKSIEFSNQEDFIKNYYVVPLYFQEIEKFFEDLPERAIMTDAIFSITMLVTILCIINRLPAHFYTTNLQKITGNLAKNSITSYKKSSL